MIDICLCQKSFESISISPYSSYRMIHRLLFTLPFFVWGGSFQAPSDGSKTREIVKAATATRPKLEGTKGKATRK
jgi:hypothetical protein